MGDGGNGPPSIPPNNRCSASGPGDDSHTSRYSLLRRLWAMLTCSMQPAGHITVAAACVLGLMAAIPQPVQARQDHSPSDSAGNGTKAAHAPGDEKDWMMSVAEENGRDVEVLHHGNVPPPRGGPMSAVKRLLRDVFVDLHTIKQQIEDLQPRSEDDDVVIPHDGGSVGPVMRPVVPGVHLKAKAQLSGDVSWRANLLNTGQGSHAPSVMGGCEPQVSILLQTMWPDKTHSLTARLASTGELPVASAAGMAPSSPLTGSPPASHTNQTLPIASRGAWPGDVPSRLGSSIALESLLYRCEALGGRLKLCLAPLGGSLSNMARRLNPTAGVPRLTAVASQGHGITMALEQGSGAVATWVAPAPSSSHDTTAAGPRGEGALSASLGHFSTPGPGSASHTVGQVSLHTMYRGCISLVASSAQYCAQSNSQMGHVVSLQGTLTSPGTALQGAQPVNEARGQSSRHRLVRLGLNACTTVADACTVAAWHACSLRPLSSTSTETVTHGAGGDGLGGSLCAGGSSTGVQVCTLPDANGVSLALTWAATQSTSHRTGGGAFTASQAHGQPGQRPIMEATRGNMQQLQNLAHVAELSAHVPLRDGLSLTPGVVLVGGQGQGTRLHMACGSTWRF